MKKNIKISLTIIIILLGLGALLWQIYELPKEETVSQEASPECNEINALFQCDEGKWVDVVFYNCEDEENYADLSLSDGQEIRVYRAISASGARYLSQDESIEFWNKGDSCFINENEEATFENCLEEGAIPPDETANKTIEVGELMIIELSENPTTGYSWRYNLEGEEIIEIISNKYEENENPEEMVGVGGKRILTVEGLSQGTATINLEYCRQGDPEEIAKVIKVVVEVQ